METTLHRQLKALYAGDQGRQEARVDGFRIDAVGDGRLIEVQHGSLSAIRRKVARLLEEHDVLVVKPIVLSRLLVKRRRKNGPVQHRRRSPKRGRALDLFHELIYFTRVFPHPRLTLEAPLIDIEEWRYPGHGRRRRWRASDYRIEDQRLVAVHETLRLRDAADLRRLAPAPLPTPFHTAHLAEALDVPRWFAQRVAYCFRETGAARPTGKQGNTLLYEFAEM